MNERDATAVTELLDRWNQGDQEAIQHILALVYDDLRRIADRVLTHERQGHTLQPTALVHELYLRFSNLREMRIENRRHLYGAAASAMRRILVDYARRRKAGKRFGASGPPVHLDDVPERLLADGRGLDYERLDDALAALAAHAPDKAQVVELRHFAGLSIEETAEVLGVSPATVKRQWAVARAWLYRELAAPGGALAPRERMTPQDSETIDTLFEAALAVPRESRPALLAARCPDGLRAELDSLLAAHDAAEGFLEPLGQPLRSPMLARLDVGSDAGPYRLTDVLGEGGMGRVFLATRADGTFTQQVAVKVLRRLGTRDDERRFASERQILADLKHPSIVTLIDGGTTPGGEAYLVMERVEGDPITTWTATVHASLEQRLRVFRQVCSAVHAAHQRGIVHRDLKPANILVTAAGLPKVLDFGIAKLVGRGAAAGTATDLLTGPLTPNYASPEQLRGLHVTTASDVYSLGVLLFEVLAGVRPYEVTGKPVDEVLRTALDETPRKPSLAARQRTSLPYAPARLRGDIDAIVARAMHVDPSQRYGSAEELSDDVARFLGGRPVVAREPSMAYLLKKVASRHRAVMAVAAFALLAIVGALAVAVWQWRRAEARFDDARNMATAMIFKIHDAVAPLNGSTEARKLIVGEALQYLDALAHDRGDDQLQLELAQGYKKIGRAQGDPNTANLGDRQGALASFERAAALLDPLKTSRTVGRQAADELIGTYRLIGSVQQTLGRREASRETAARALAEAEAMRRRYPGDDEALRHVASAHFSVALAKYPGDDALPHWEEAGRLFEQLLSAKPDDLDRMRNVALVGKYLGTFMQDRDRDAEAAQLYERALTLDDKRLAVNPSSRSAQTDVAIDLANLASVRIRERGTDAIALYERSIEMRRRLLDTDPKDVFARRSLASVLGIAANAYRHVDDLENARRRAMAALEVARPLDDGKATFERRLFATPHLVLAFVGTKSGDSAGACEQFTIALRLLDHPGGDPLKSNERWLVDQLTAALPSCPAAKR